MVRKMMGFIKSFTISINLVPSHLNSTALSGAKCPNNAPAVMAVSTQKVRLVKIFFILGSYFEKMRKVFLLEIPKLNPVKIKL
jgi:hypothetical protein